ncbi:hypothetical protein GCM10023090_24030 [Acidovorax lacteus]|uniref:Pyrrolo-quinoline quinone repeat domain-containing protein n=2 Tax=Acidovorax lacteus TaxID=1924988 RepID=A0ABP8LE00_9BURK
MEAVREIDGASLWKTQSSIQSTDEAVIASSRVFGNDSRNGVYGYAFNSGARDLLLPHRAGRPQTDGNTVYMGAPAASGSGSIISAFDARTGSLRWTTPTDVSSSISAYQRFAVDGQHLYSFSFNKLRAYRVTDGAEALTIPHNLGETSISRPLTAIAYGNQKVIGGYYTWSQAYLAAFSIPDKKQNWEVRDGFRSLPSVADGLFYIAAAQPNTNTVMPVLQARSLDTGAVVWSAALPDDKESTRDENYEVVTVGNMIFVSSDRIAGGATYAIDRDSKRVVWSYPVNGQLAVTAFGTLLIKTINGNIFAIALQ